MRFGLIGKTLKHSFSKNYFTEKFRIEGRLDYSYENFELPAITGLPALIQHNPDLKGFNITIPYKEEIIPYLHSKNEIVEAIGACNCVKIYNGQMFGFNTDVVGFRQTLEKRLQPWHKKALVLGTGGASKAVQYALQQLEISYLLVSRNKDFDRIGYEEVGEELLKDYLLIINTTPLGMYPDTESEPSIPYDLLTSRHFLYDLVYNPEKTNFLLKGEKKGAQICNGYEMLILQAEESWRIWVDPSIPSA